MSVIGNFTVEGTTTSVNLENVNTKDRFLYLNNEYDATTSSSGGIVINSNAVNPLVADTITATASVNSITTTGSGTFSSNDIIQIKNSDQTTNDGIYVVAAHTGTALTIKTSGVPFAHNSIAAGSTTGTIHKVNIQVIQYSSVANAWQTTSGDNDEDVLTDNPKTILLSGNASSSSSLELTNTTNQIVFDHGGNDIDETTLNVAQAARASIYTVLDVGPTANFVMSEGSQTLGGAYTLSDAATLALSDSTTFTIEDVGASHVYTIAPGALTTAATMILPNNVSGTNYFASYNDTNRQILVEDGGGGWAVSAPTYSFSTNTDTGMLYTPSGEVRLSVDSGLVLEALTTGVSITGDLKYTGSMLDSVKAWSGAGAHVMTVSGSDGARVHTVSHTAAASITLLSVTASENGLKFTIISLVDTGGLTLNTSDSDLFDNEIGSIVLSNKHERFTLQYIDSETKWYIVN